MGLKKGEQSPPDEKTVSQSLVRADSELREEHFRGSERKDSKAKTVMAGGVAVHNSSGSPEDNMGTFFTRSFHQIN